MPRAPVPVLFLAIIILFWIVSARADCWYNNEMHEEGSEVTTAEPCLNCTCTRGALLCYLRVCPRLPNPPPQGCILLHRYRTCCPELVCTDFPRGNRIEARSDDEIDLYDESDFGNACVNNGTIYGPGSAMGTSSLCEYCYCLHGKQHCVKPKCLLPMKDCTPIYEPHSCCPVRYNCTRQEVITTTTTGTPINIEIRGGCIVSGKYYPEGGKVLGVGHSVCDNCYCIRGLLRCEPLSCAPPLLGCTPVIKPGQCCAASYNCSGTIETHPEPYYGHFPIVSKEYAKLRKEVQASKKWGQQQASESSNIPYYVIAESQPSENIQKQRFSSQGTTRQFNPSTKLPHFYKISSSDSLQARTTKQQKHTTKIYDDILDHRIRPVDLIQRKTMTTQKFIMNLNEDLTTTTPMPKSEAEVEAEIEESTTPLGDVLVMEASAIPVLTELIDGRLNRRIDNENSTEIPDDLIISTFETTTNFPPETTFSINDESFKENTTLEMLDDVSTTDNLFTTTLLEMLKTTLQSSNVTNENELDSMLETEMMETTTELQEETPTAITFKTVINTTDCVESKSKNDTMTNIKRIDGDENQNQNKNQSISSSSKMDEGIVTTTDSKIDPMSTSESQFDVTVVDLESKLKVDLDPLKIPLEIEAILNMTKTKNKEIDYDYDYNEPTLPPSLPNLRIFKFVAADAVDSKKEIEQNNIHQERVTESSVYSYTNLFSPPVETEGGFVPKEPPILVDPFYDKNYHQSNIDDNAVTSIPVPAITNPPNIVNNENNCIHEGREVQHEERISSERSCVMCVCYYGNIVCQKPTCPSLPTGCRHTNTIDSITCCPQIICANESPTLVLGRVDVTPSPPQEPVTASGVVSMDPFQNVIRTEHAPDLHSLIEDIPYYVRPTLSTTQFPPKLIKEVTTTKPIINQKAEDKIDTQEEVEGDVNYNDNEGFSLDSLFKLFTGGILSNDNKNKTINNAQLINETNTAAPLVAAAITTERPINKETTTGIITVSSSKKNTTLSSTTSSLELQNREITNEDSIQSNNVGPLKLAGCNIYGRMYRVGRIIYELSTPCQECKCTEIGVQCKTLKC